MKVFLVRHGRTRWSDEKRFHGEIDIELNEVGLRQAALISSRMKEAKIGIIYSSDLQRAHRTAETIKNFTNAELVVDPRLNEIALGQWAGKTWKEIKVEYADFLQDWFVDIVNTPPPGGESYSQLQARSLEMFNSIDRHRETDCAIVTHDAVIKVILSSVLGLSLKNRSRFEISHASISTLIHIGSKDEYKVLNINDVAHLNAPDSKSIV